MNTILEAEGLSHIYRSGKREVQALNDVRLDLRVKENVFVTGPSGCGKSTLLLALAGLLTPTSGKVKLWGEDLFGLSRQRRARLRRTKVAFVFQSMHLIPYLDVEENIRLNAREEDRDWGRRLLSKLGLEQRRKHLSTDLSVGERQRVAVARSLGQSPQIIFADEPTGNLDPESARYVFEAFEDFRQSGGAMITVTHSESYAKSGSRLLRMEAGRLLN